MNQQPHPTNVELIDSVQNLPEQDGLVFACRLDGTGGGKLIDWNAVEQWRSDQGPVWIHLDRTNNRAQSWLREQSGLTSVTCDAILAPETRPRAFHAKNGFVAILRGVNLNPHSDPEDMVTLRIWSDGVRLISLRHRKLLSTRDVLEQLIDSRRGPCDASELFERLITRLTERMSVATNVLSEALDAIEEHVDSEVHANSSDRIQSRRDLGNVRHGLITLRRFMAPQREALSLVYFEPPEWLASSARLRLRESNDQLQRYIEDLDLQRERASVIKDDIANQLAETLNRNMYILSIVAALFLPLGFATGLLGINVGGIPGVENASAFWIVCVSLTVIVALEIVIFRKLKWI